MTHQLYYMPYKWVYIAAMAYMSVSGGPFGIEEVLHHVALYKALAIILMGCVMHMLPTAFMTYEMMLVYNKHEGSGGSISWVKHTLGDSVALINAVYSIVDTAVDNAIYPVMVRDNLAAKGPTIPIVVCLICAGLNWKNTEFTGKITLVQTLIVISPFVYLMLSTPISENMYIDKRSYGENNTFDALQQALMIVVWNVSGFDMCASYVHSLWPTKAEIKKGFVVASLTTVFSYIIVICCGTYYIHDKQTWKDGSWSTIASVNTGELGQTWMQLASIISSVGTLCVELCATSHLWMGLVEIGAAPSLLQSTKVNLIINTLITMVLSTTQKFETLVDLSALLNVVTIVIESTAWLKTFGSGTFRWRAFSVFFLITINVGVSACGSAQCIASFAVVTAVALVWLTVVRCTRR